VTPPEVVWGRSELMGSVRGVRGGWWGSELMRSVRRPQ